MNYRELQRALKNLKDNGAWVPAVNLRGKRAHLQKAYDSAIARLEAAQEVQIQGSRAIAQVRARAGYLEVVFMSGPKVYSWAVESPMAALIALAQAESVGRKWWELREELNLGLATSEQMRYRAIA